MPNVEPERVAGRARSGALALSWLAYASYYLGRKGFSVVKTSIAREQGLSAGALGLIDSAYLLAYACGQLPSGIAADRWGPRRVIACGMLLSAAACAQFGALSGALALAACFALNGLAQSTGWPGTTKVVAAWTSADDRGRVMGIWATCYQVGGIAATALATWLLAHFGWRAVFRVPAVWLVLMAAVVWVALRPGPRAFDAQPRTSAESWADLRAVLRLPALYSYGACYFCIKLIRYSLLFWLPYYLHSAAGFDEIASGYLSTGLEVGGVLGSVGLGYCSDRWAHSRALWAGASLLGLAGALLGYANLGALAAPWHFAGLALVGALLFGPDALLSGAAAQDLAGSASAGTAVGVVNGLGSAGALCQGALTVGVAQALGWNALLHVFVGLALVAALCLVPAVRTR